MKCPDCSKFEQCFNEDCMLNKDEDFYDEDDLYMTSDDFIIQEYFNKAVREDNHD